MKQWVGDGIRSEWSPVTVELINQLESVQRRFTKRLPGFQSLRAVWRALCFTGTQPPEASSITCYRPVAESCWRPPLTTKVVNLLWIPSLVFTVFSFVLQLPQLTRTYPLSKPILLNQRSAVNDVNFQQTLQREAFRHALKALRTRRTPLEVLTMPQTP